MEALVWLLEINYMTVYGTCMLSNARQVIHSIDYSAIITIISVTYCFRHTLGTVLEALSEFESAAECLMTSVDLESTSPVVPFSSVHRVLH